MDSVLNPVIRLFRQFSPVQKRLLGALCAVLLLTVCGYALSQAMTTKSIYYEPLYSIAGMKRVELEKQIPYSASSKFSTSVSFPDLTAGPLLSLVNAASLLKTINETKGAASALQNMESKSGALYIPRNASEASFQDIAVYGWKKEYKVFFNLFKRTDSEGVIVFGNQAWKGKLGGRNHTVLAEISVYQLKN